MFAVHCTFLAEGYVLLAAGDNVDPMMFQEKDEEPDDGLPKRKPDPHVGWNDMDDEYAFKYCALADYDNTAQAPAPAHVGAILKAIFIGNTLMCHSVRTEDGARAHHDPAAPLASLELPMGTHAKVVDEVAIAADPTLSIAWNGLSIALAARGDLVEAVEAANKLVELEPDDALSHTNLSRILMQQGKIPEAEDARGVAMRIQMKSQGSS